jgi:hypothetical protein
MNKLNEHYLNIMSDNKEENYIFGTMYVNKGNTYFITTYIPNYIENKTIIFDEDNKEIICLEYFSNFLFNLSIFLIRKEIVNKPFKNFAYKLNNNDNQFCFINTLDKPIEIELSKLKYNLIDGKHPKLFKICIISIDIDIKHIENIFIGASVYSKQKKLYGIVSHIEQNDDKYYIIVIPSYTINKFLTNIKNNVLCNIWLDIDDKGCITKIYDNDIIDKLDINDKISKINNKKVDGSLIYDETINLDIPVQTYLWYNQYNNKKEIFKIEVERKNKKIVVDYEYKSIDNIMMIDFNHNKKKLSFELIDYLVDNDIYIQNSYMEQVFREPFNKKINSSISTFVFDDKDIYDLNSLLICKMELTSGKNKDITFIDLVE